MPLTREEIQEKWILWSLQKDDKEKARKRMEYLRRKSRKEKPVKPKLADLAFRPTTSDGDFLITWD